MTDALFNCTQRLSRCGIRGACGDGSISLGCGILRGVFGRIDQGHGWICHAYDHDFWPVYFLAGRYGFGGAYWRDGGHQCGASTAAGCASCLAVREEIPPLSEYCHDWYSSCGPNCALHAGARLLLCSWLCRDCIWSDPTVWMAFAGQPPKPEPH